MTETTPIAERALPEPAERERRRRQSGVSQTGLARMIGVTRRTVYAYEHGTQEPTGNRRERYAAILASWELMESERAS